METRLKKSLQNCGICLQKITESGQLNTCRHSFCLECIKNWAEIENTCPLCKKRFRKIESKTMRKKYCPRETDKTKDIEIQDRNQESDFENRTLSLEDFTQSLLVIMELQPQLLNSFLSNEGIDFQINLDAEDSDNS